MANHHDTGYKELFSYPEFVEQLIEGFAPPEVAAMMDFSTLKNHSGHYITPLFEEKFEDVVWSVQVRREGVVQQVYVYILLEFQSTIDHSMPIRRRSALTRSSPAGSSAICSAWARSSTWIGCKV